MPSVEAGTELLPVLIPPALSSIETFLATHLRPHGDEVHVAGFDAPTYELAAASDRFGHDLHQLWRAVGSSP